jgi:multiple sugar transport system permease protein
MSVGQQPDVRSTSAVLAARPATHLAGETGMVERRRARWLPFSPWHFLLMPVAILMLVPLLWVVMTSLETLGQTQHFPPILWPGKFQWSNYPRAWSSVPFDTWFINTTIVTVTVVASNLLLCSLAAYGFARIRFWGKNVAYFFLLATLMIPVQVVIIPTFLIVKQMHLIDTLGALIVPNLANVFGIFLLTQFFRTLPIELEEAARIDGASRLKVLFTIVLPLSLPALATLAVIQFLWTWNDFLWPLVTIYNEQVFTIQLGLMSFQGSHVNDTNLLMAGNVMSMLPMLILFIAAQRYFVRGIATQGLKG